MGDALLLYRGERRLEGKEKSWLSEMVIKVGKEPRATVVTPTTAGDLEVVVREACEEIKPDGCGKKEAEQYLVERLRGWDGQHVEYRAKIGSAQLRYQNRGLGTPLTLSVVPTSNWVERQFNRRLLSGGDAELARVGRECRQATFAAWPGQETFCFAAPGVLYLESCLICSDGAAVLLKKKAEDGSTFARIGRAWTCGTETGLDWTALGPGGEIDWNGAVVAELGRDLDLKSEQIGDIRWEGFALEVHLNVALLCTVRLQLDHYGMLQHLKRAGGAYEDTQVLDREEAIGYLEKEGAHSTAALRLVLAGGG